MTTLVDIDSASPTQLKNWAFALGYLVKPRLHGEFVEYAKLYKEAKSNLGCKSLPFELGTPIYHDPGSLGCLFRLSMLVSLEVIENQIRGKTRLLRVKSHSYIHEAILDREWAHVATDVSRCKANYHRNTKHVAAQFWEEEKSDALFVLSDSLEEYDDATFEAEHLRTGHHGPACPIIQRIVKGIV